MLLLQFCDRSHDNCPCNICRSLQIMPARICQKKTFIPKRDIRSFCRLIMYDRTVTAIGYDRRKALSQIMGHLLPVAFQLFCRGKLCSFFLPGSDLCLQPADKTCYRNAVPDVRQSFIFYFRMIFHCFFQCDRALGGHNLIFAVQKTYNFVIYRICIQPDPASRRKRFKILIKVLICPDIDCLLKYR